MGGSLLLLGHTGLWWQLLRRIMSLGDQPLGLVRITRILFELFCAGFCFVMSCVLMSLKVSLINNGLLSFSAL